MTKKHCNNGENGEDRDDDGGGRQTITHALIKQNIRECAMSWAAQLWVAKRCSCNDSCSLEWLLYLWHCGGAELKSPKPAYWIYNWPNSTQMSQMATVEEVEEWMRTCMSSSSTFQPCHIVNWDKLFWSSEYIYQLHTLPIPHPTHLHNKSCLAWDLRIFYDLFINQPRC